jgi:dephospho-CoA kinase
MAQRAPKKHTVIIGLTGSIGMGKSTVADLLRKIGLPIHSADEVVHNAMKKGGKAVALVADLFPDVVKRSAIDRKLLGSAVFGKPKKLRELEKIIHPLVWASEKAFLQKVRKKKSRAAILEIPLLFETGAEERCDLVFCVAAPKAIQKARVLARPGMTLQKFRAILAYQMPNTVKCKKADYVIPTGKGLAATEKHLRKLLGKLSLLS